MNYGYTIPPPPISDYVREILVIDDFKITNPFTLPLFANGSPTLVFQTKKTLLNKTPAGHFTLFGQTIQPGAFTIAEDFTLIAYFFKPHALVSLFNVEGRELSDTHTDLNLLDPSGSKELQERLFACTSANDMVLLLNKFVLSLIGKTKVDASRINLAASFIEKTPATDGLKTVQKELCITEKTLHRLFESKVGVSPRMYKRIVQFNMAFQQLNHRKFVKLSDIAYQNGYADQSHFIRNFKEFTNLTPKEYLQFTTAGS